MQAPWIRSFREIGLADVPSVGGKNASLGEMISQLAEQGIPVPDGFATTALAFEDFLRFNHLHTALRALLAGLDHQQYTNLRTIGAAARTLLLQASLPPHFQRELLQAYHQLGKGQPIAVAVRSSATAEDLPEASFAGQHESFLNIRGEEALLQAVQRCFASLYTDRAIKYREDNGFQHEKVALSVGVQLMVRSDLASAGVLFTLEPESGFRDLIHISGLWGLGENIVQGTVTPDEYLVFKPLLGAVSQPILQKKLGDKEWTMVFADDPRQPVQNKETPASLRASFVLSDPEIIQLATWGRLIEAHYGKPMDIEWAKDGVTQELFIIQARPETVQSRGNPYLLKEYRLNKEGARVLVSGQAVGNSIATGIARILKDSSEADKLQPGEIIITDLTSPDWDPILKKAAAIITNKGGRTSHASIVARELGVPAIVGCDQATEQIRDGSPITVSCCEGKTGNVYEGLLTYNLLEHDFSKVKMPEKTKMMLIAGDPDKAFQLSFYPNDGVGLLRMEFMITHAIKIHPMALVHFDRLDKSLPDTEKIIALTRGYADKRAYFIDQLSQGIAVMAAAFYPKPVILRMSDFKSNEYANLLGGAGFEPREENPMLGFRGAARYYHERYREGFRLECEAVKRVREENGLTNLKLMIPFCRTVEEGEKVIAVMDSYGLSRGVNGLEIYVMAEIPSNVLLAADFARVFDGFSIGSNDLTQLTLGVDRDSALVSSLFNENNPAARQMIEWAIRNAHAAGRPIGLCGQAPSDDPTFARLLLNAGIDSISFTPDALLAGIANSV
ncbi:phosphoenolpyruvate synthase [Flavihumibacter sp. CACIAM 22H1]|uniref:phosphoenolpyruvate synthase n=1 Tax=Flavihumibacter sp. CACIAM 22H1 TaxID=1812911 RepID=UPI0007A8BC7B|nr:phosphoenolpyruvate synthase [Flavihumibacter sp. CACIAM 22H1]KYP14543.1 MAG: phosphoenolpyruvate synthase [Flavihumibacter sp. CACIAM 22H1]